MIVDERLIVENKSVEPLPPIAKRQLLAYLRSTRFEVGLLLHFGHRARFHRQIDSNHCATRDPPANAERDQKRTAAEFTDQAEAADPSDDE
jgi:hypothetical protein